MTGIRVLFFGVLLSSLAACSSFQFDEYHSFGEWFVGGAGLQRAIDEEEMFPLFNTIVLEERSPIYGHFRLFEIVFQPGGGGVAYPERLVGVTDTYSTTGSMYAGGQTTRSTGHTEYRAHGDSHDSYNYDLLEAGRIEVLPIRTWNSDRSVLFQIGNTLLQPLTVGMGLCMDALIRGPTYVLHDTIKTALIPAAIIHYALEEDLEVGKEY